jgi:COP9 signalosome complex subunit 3
MQAATASGKAAPRQLSTALLPEGTLWPYVTNFLLSFDPVQVRYAGELLIKLVGVVVQGAEQTQNVIPAIQLLNQVILRLDPTSSTFTSTHHAYVRLCLLARAYAEAVDILERPIYHIPAAVDKQTDGRSYKYKCSPTESSATYLTPTMGLTLKITSKGYLEYYLMGALCYMGVGLYEKALAFLEIVLAAPAQQNATSLIAVEAYKKWILLNLLVHGHISELPKSASQTVIRHIRAIAKPYDCVAEAFKSKDRQRLQAEIEQGMEVWNEDLNYGLMVEIFNAHRKFAISRLGKTYAAIPVAEIARQTSTEPEDAIETLVYLQDLITTGSLNATITHAQNGTDPMLRFLPESSSQRSEDLVEQELAIKSQELQALLKHIADIENRTEISREYVEFLRKLKKTRDDDKKDAASTAAAKAKQATSLDEVDEEMMDEF